MLIRYGNKQPIYVQIFRAESIESCYDADRQEAVSPRVPIGTSNLEYGIERSA